MKECNRQEKRNDQYYNGSDIVIYSTSLNYYLKRILKLVKEFNTPNNYPPRRLAFWIMPQDFKKIIGRKIEKLVYQLIKHKARFLIYPPPPCLFLGKFPKIFRDRFYNPESMVPPIFFQESFIKYAISEEDRWYINNKKVTIISKCLTCTYKTKKICQGIFELTGAYICHEKLHEWINQKIDNKQKVNLLDVGCGFNQVYWDLYNNLSNKDINLYLLDPDESIIKSLKGAIVRQSNIYFIQNTIENAMLGPKKFDIILLLETYYHLKNIKMAFNNIRKLLKKDGILIIKNTEDPKGFNFKNEPVFSGHLRHDDLLQIISKLKKYKFTIAEIATDNILSGELSGIIKVQK